jgi:hypothetical protein
MWPWDNIKVDTYSQLVNKVHKEMENRICGDLENSYWNHYTLFRGQKE